MFRFSQILKSRPFLRAFWVIAVGSIWLSPAIQAQRVRLGGDSFVLPNGQIPPPMIKNVTSTQNTTPQVQIQNAPPVQSGNPPAVIQQSPGAGTQVQGQVGLPQPTFDPFAIQTQGLQGGASTTVPPTGVIIAPGQSNTPTQPPPFIYPPPAGSTQSPLVVPPSCAPGTCLPQPFGYNNANGSYNNSARAWPAEFWARLRGSNIYRFLERPRWRHTYLAGGDSTGGRGLGLNESDIATTLSLPNFLFTTQPIRISPGYIFHFWEGPDSAVTGADLPSQTNSVYLANDFSTPWDRRLGAEVNLTVGLYTDFEEITSDSIRITGLGLGWFRLNNTTTFKLGVEYLDRLDIKLLPAGGFFIYPTPDLKLDIYFPRPRLAQRLPNLGTLEVWGYIGGEYGGGSWTIKRRFGAGDQVDVNDIRVFVGLEWIGPRRITGFIEGGYVFDREMIYRSDPTTAIQIDDTGMVRAGIAF